MYSQNEINKLFTYWTYNSCMDNFDQNIKKIKFYYLKMLPLLSLQDSMMADPNLCLSIMQK